MVKPKLTQHLKVGEQVTFATGKKRTIEEIVLTRSAKYPYAIRFLHDAVFYAYNLRGKHNADVGSPMDIILEG